MLRLESLGLPVSIRRLEPRFDFANSIRCHSYPILALPNFRRFRQGSSAFKALIAGG
jgi:hypothetical protein